jgi:hypothetical protein
VPAEAEEPAVEHAALVRAVALERRALDLAAELGEQPGHVEPEPRKLVRAELGLVLEASCKHDRRQDSRRRALGCKGAWRCRSRCSAACCRR